MHRLRESDDERYKKLRETEELTITGRSMRLQWKVTNAGLVKNQDPKQTYVTWFYLLVHVNTVCKDCKNEDFVSVLKLQEGIWQ